MNEEGSVMEDICVNKKIVIIGAGNSGRGFLARLLSADGADLCFLDKDEALVQKLVSQRHFSVFVGESKVESVIRDYQAYGIDSDDAVKAAMVADYIFVCVGKQHLAELTSFFIRLCKGKKPDQCQVVVCENGISPKNTLRKALAGTEAEGMKISQGVIFCTSIPREKGKLDIVSEAYEELPIDYDEELFCFDSPHFPFIKGFDLLMERKLYTYNCLSACIAYLGYLKRYTDYGEAARDPEIYRFCDQLRESLDEAVCKKTGVSREEQRKFSQHAMNKFTSPVITDTIEKNARAALRKIGPEERLMGPLRLFLHYGQDGKPLYKVIAAALYYLEQEEGLEYEGRAYEDTLVLLQAVNPWIQAEEKSMREITEFLLDIREHGVVVI